MPIGELADATGTSARTLRFHEERGLLPWHARTSSGMATSPPTPPTPSTGSTLIHRGQAAGLPLEEIRQVLELRVLHERADTVDHERCDPDEICRYL